MKKFKVGLIGATGMVGQRFVKFLCNHPWFELTLLSASENSKGKTYEEAVKNRWKMDIDIPENLKDKILLDSVSDREKICSSVDFVFCAVNMEKEKLKELEYSYARSECPVISNNSAHRWTEDVPMLIPEVNPDHVKVIDIQKKRLGTKKGFIATKPNCSLQCFVPAIFPLMKFNIKSVIVSTYQAISGAGKTFSEFPEIQDNVIPYIQGEEEKTEKEPLKILGQIGKSGIVNLDSMNIISNCIRVPVSNGHLASVFVEFENKVTEEEIINIWENFNSPVSLPSSPKKFIKYFHDLDRPQPKLDKDRDNGMGINIGHLKQYDDNKIKFVCMADNIARGAAGGAILFAELLCDKGYLY